MTIIVEAGNKDVLTYYSIAREYAEAMPEHFKTDEEVYRKTVLDCLYDDEHTIFLAKRNGESIGLLVVSKISNYLSGEVWAIEKVLYVSPEFRGGPTGLRLIKYFENWAKEQGCSSAILNSVEGVTPLNLYSRLGYETIERVHRKEL